MATLKRHGEVLSEMIACWQQSDGADGDPMTRTIRKTYRIMSDGQTLVRSDVRTDYGTGGNPEWHNGTWKLMLRKDGKPTKVKAEMLADNGQLMDGMQTWADGLRAKGWDAEIS